MERLPGLNAIISSLIHTQDGPCRPFTATSSNFIHFTEKSYILPLPFFQIIQGYLTFDSKKDGISHSEMGGTLVAADSSINPMLPFNNLHSVFTRSNFHLKKPLSSHITRVTPKDARIEGHDRTSYGNTKITTNQWTASSNNNNKNLTGTCQKSYPTFKDKEETSVRQ